MLEVVPHKESWSDSFDVHRKVLREIFKETALAISHIGSTAIADLVAKPIIDIQVSVRTLDEVDQLASLPDGYTFISENTSDLSPIGYTTEVKEWEKRYVHVVREGKRQAQIHIREAGRTNERLALLFRDFVRQHPLHRAAYGQMKLQLVDAVGHLASETSSGPYVELKDPLISVILAAAEEWASATGWSVDHAR